MKELTLSLIVFYLASVAFIYASDPLKDKFPDLKNLVVTDGELQVLLDVENEETRVRLE